MVLAGFGEFWRVFSSGSPGSQLSSRSLIFSLQIAVSIVSCQFVNWQSNNPRGAVRAQFSHLYASATCFARAKRSLGAAAEMASHWLAGRKGILLFPPVSGDGCQNCASKTGPKGKERGPRDRPYTTTPGRRPFSELQGNPDESLSPSLSVGQFLSPSTRCRSPYCNSMQSQGCYRPRQASDQA